MHQKYFYLPEKTADSLSKPEIYYRWCAPSMCPGLLDQPCDPLQSCDPLIEIHYLDGAM